MFKDFPDLKIIVSHGGGAIPYQRGRFYPGAFRQGTTYREILRNLYYDTCLYTQDSIELLIKAVGADRCLFGTEKPGTGSVKDPATGRWVDDIHLLIDGHRVAGRGLAGPDLRGQRPAAVPAQGRPAQAAGIGGPDMAKIVAGIGSSHGPQLKTPPGGWPERGVADRRNRALVYQGKDYAFDDLKAARGDFSARDHTGCHAGPLGRLPGVTSRASASTCARLTWTCW